MIIVLLFLGFAHAAWPDSYPQRIAMMEAFRLQFATPDIPVDPFELQQKYGRACELGFTLACKAERWSPESDNPIGEASKVFGPRCRTTKSPLGCVLVAFELGLVDGELTNEGLNPVKSRALFEQSCEEKLYAPACSYLGHMLLNGIGGERDEKSGIERLNEGCKAEDPWGCYQVGLQILASDRPAGEAKLDRACRGGVMSSCLAFAESLSKHASSNEQWSQIAPYLSQSCQWKNQSDCIILAGMNMQGRGVPRRPLVGLTLYESACNVDILEGCIGAAEYYERTGDATKATRRFERACQLNDAESCARYGLSLLKGAEGVERASEGLILLQRACSDGFFSGCMGLAEAYKSGLGVDANLEMAFKYSAMACEGGLGKSCTLQARLQESLSLWEQGDASDLFERGCQLGDGKACAAVALRELSTSGFTAEIKNAIIMGCENDDVESCRVLGENQLNTDPDSAVKSLTKACFGGDDQACLIAARHLLNSTGNDISEAATLLGESCHRGHGLSCDELKPISFNADFIKLTDGAFLSALCQVWSVDERNPEDNHLLGEVSGGEFTIFIGEHRNREITAENIKSEFLQQGKIQLGRSFWNLKGQSEKKSESHPWKDTSQVNDQSDGDVVWGTNAQTANEIWSQLPDWQTTVTHEEKWLLTKPGSFLQAVDGYGLLHGDFGTVRFARSTETLTVETGCGFVVPRTTLYTEHCSDIQALLAGSLLQRCD